MVGVAGMPASYIARAASMDALCWQLEALGWLVLSLGCGSWPSPFLSSPWFPWRSWNCDERGQGESRALPPAGLARLCVPCLFRALSSSSGQSTRQARDWCRRVDPGIRPDEGHRRASVSSPLSAIGSFSRDLSSLLLE